jgi:hypothetical protein
MSCRKSLVVTSALLATGLLFSHGAWASRSLFTSPPSGSSGSTSYVGILWSKCWNETNAPSSEDKGGVAVYPFNEQSDSAYRCTEVFGTGTCDEGIPGNSVSDSFQLTKFGKPGVPHLIHSMSNIDFVAAGVVPKAEDIPSGGVGIQLATDTRNAGHYIVIDLTDNNTTLVLDPNTRLQKSEVTQGAIASDLVNSKITRLDTTDGAKVCTRLFNDDGTSEYLDPDTKTNAEGIGTFTWESLSHRDCSYSVDPDTGVVTFDRPCRIYSSVDDTKQDGSPQGGTLLWAYERHAYDEDSQPVVRGDNYAADTRSGDAVWGMGIGVPSKLNGGDLKKNFDAGGDFNKGDSFVCTFHADGSGFGSCGVKFCNTNFMLNPGQPTDCNFSGNGVARPLAEVPMNVDNNLTVKSTTATTSLNIDNTAFILTSKLDPTGAGITVTVEGPQAQEVSVEFPPQFGPHSAVVQVNSRETLCAYDKSRVPDEVGDLIPGGTEIHLRLEGPFPASGGLFGQGFTTTNQDFDPTAEGACP